MVKKYIAILGIAFFLFVCIALPLTNFENLPTSFNSLSADSTSSATIGKYYFSTGETEFINSKIQEAD